jgi:predicted small lipoprotein YifL
MKLLRSVLALAALSALAACGSDPVAVPEPTLQPPSEASNATSTTGLNTGPEEPAAPGSTGLGVMGSGG